MTDSNNSSNKEFSKKVWSAASIVLLLILLLWFVKATFNVLLLVLAGSLIALFFKGLAGMLAYRLHVPKKASMPIAVIGTLLIVTLFFWFMGSRIQQQISQLSDTLPAAFNGFVQELNKTELGKKIIGFVESDGQAKKLPGIMQSLFKSTFGVLGDIYVVFFLGIFFTAGSRVYVKGFLLLIPPKGRPKANIVLRELGTNLTKWLKGQLFSMLVVAILTVIGLLILGVPMAFALALIAGMLSFIPNFGPLIAIIPAVLVGLMQDTTTALLVAGLYIAVQVLESNFITPKIQERLINTPPALIILSQLFIGVLTGGWGLVLAVPIVVIVMVVLQQLYIKPNETA